MYRMMICAAALIVSFACMPPDPSEAQQNRGRHGQRNGSDETLEYYEKKIAELVMIGSYDSLRRTVDS